MILMSNINNILKADKGILAWVGRDQQVLWLIRNDLCPTTDKSVGLIECAGDIRVVKDILLGKCVRSIEC